MDVSGVYLFIYLFFLFFTLFYFIPFLLVSLKCKDVEDGGSISVYQAASCWTVYFSPGTRAGSNHD